MFLSNFFGFKSPVKSKNTGKTTQEILNRIYRGQAYQEVSNKQKYLKISGKNTNKKMIKCIYRGQVYHCISNKQKSLEVSEAKTVEFIYRGQTYTRQFL